MIVYQLINLLVIAVNLITVVSCGYIYKQARSLIKINEIHVFITKPSMYLSFSFGLFSLSLINVFTYSLITNNFTSDLIMYEVHLVVISMYVTIQMVGLKFFLELSASANPNSIRKFYLSFMVAFTSAIFFLFMVYYAIFTRYDASKIVGAGGMLFGVFIFSLYRINIQQEIKTNVSILAKARLDQLKNVMTWQLIWILVSIPFAIIRLIASDDPVIYWFTFFGLNFSYGLCTLIGNRYLYGSIVLPDSIRAKYNLTSNRL